MWQMPDSMRCATAMARPMSRENTAADKPYSLSLASRIASSSVSKRSTETMGPNDSSRYTRMAGVTPSTIAGCSTLPSRPPDWMMVAPRSRASASMASTRLAAAGSIMPASGASAWAARRVAVFAASFSMKPGAILRSTRMRSADMQIWPWLKKALNAAASTAASRSASSSTTTGFLPPSSSSTGFRCSAASFAMMRPTRVDPVKLMRRTAGCATRRSTIHGASSGAFEMKLTTPGGKPASANACAISRCTAGHSSDALRITVLPQASGMATARVPRITGAFHGAMPTTTPHGWRTPSASEPGTSDGMTSPAIWVVIDAASRSMLAASVTLNWYQTGAPPASRMAASTMRGRSASIASAAASSKARRAPGCTADQAGKASRAAATAASTSSRVAAAARVATVPLAGSRRSYAAPLDAGRACPAISRSVSNIRGLLCRL